MKYNVVNVSSGKIIEVNESPWIIGDEYKFYIHDYDTDGIVVCVITDDFEKDPKHGTYGMWRDSGGDFHKAFEGAYRIAVDMRNDEINILNKMENN